MENIFWYPSCERRVLIESRQLFFINKSILMLKKIVECKVYKKNNDFVFFKKELVCTVSFLTQYATPPPNL